MGTTAPIEELEVGKEGFVAPGQTDGESFLHLVEEERLIAFRTPGPAYRLAGARRHEHLRLEAGRGDLGCFRYLGG